MYLHGGQKYVLQITEQVSESQETINILCKIYSPDENSPLLRDNNIMRHQCFMMMTVKDCCSKRIH